MSQLLNTHNYDGKLYKILIENINNVHNLTQEDKLINATNILNLMIENNISEDLIQIFRQIINGFNTAANYDPSNNLWADDIIYLLEEHKLKEDFLKLLTEQLNDMKTGFCPQGRTHRLFQLLLVFLEI